MEKLRQYADGLVGEQFMLCVDNIVVVVIVSSCFSALSICHAFFVVVMLSRLVVSLYCMSGVHKLYVLSVHIQPMLYIKQRPAMLSRFSSIRSAQCTE